MQKKYPLVSIFDAHSEKELLRDPEVISRSHSLALALGNAKLGAVGRVGSPVTSTVLTTLAEHHGTAIGISPASTEEEHKKAFRLSQVSFPLMFIGRGALGADVVVLESGHGVLIAGSDEESLLGILGCVGSRGIPIGIFTKENPNEIRALVNEHYIHLMPHLYISNDAHTIVHDISAEMRRQHLSNK